MASDDFGFQTLGLSKHDDGQKFCDIVIVHGLYGSNHNSWTDIKWTTEFLPSLGGGATLPRLSLHTYNIFEYTGGILTHQGARNEATKLLDSLKQLRGVESQGVPIIFVGHDLGGSLVKEAMVLAQRKKYEDIYTSVSLIVFLGCPHQGTKLDLQASCADLLMSHQKTTYSEAWNLSGPLVEWVQMTNNSFCESRIPNVADIYSVVSLHSDPMERVFDKSATSKLLYSKTFTTDLGHKSLLKHPISNSLREHFCFRWYHSNVVLRRYISNLSQTPLQYPSVMTAPGNEHTTLSAVGKNFQQFIDLDGADCWLVHPLESPGCGAVEIAEKVLQWTEEQAQNNKLAKSYTFFSFDTNDTYRDSAEAALSSFLVELCSQLSSPAVENEDLHLGSNEVQDILELLNVCHRTQAQDLFNACISLVLQKLALQKAESNTPLGATFTIILGNLDSTIRNGAWLFKQLEDVVHDCALRLKVVITSSDTASLTSDARSAKVTGFKSDIRPLERPPPRLELANHAYKGDDHKGEGEPLEVKDDAEVRSRLDDTTAGNAYDENGMILKSVLALIQTRPQLYGYSDMLISIAKSCGQDEVLWKMTVSWLKVAQFPKEDGLHGFLLQLTSVTPQKLFRSILTSIPSQAQPYSILLLESILFAFRPLSVPELLDLYWTNEPANGSLNLKDIIESRCSGLLTVQHNTVQMAHPDLRNFLLSRTEDHFMESGSPKSTAFIHARIATDCLRYLASQMGRRLMEDRTGPGSWHTSFECKQNFLSYAVKYWLRHATCAGKEIFQSDACTQFLADSSGIRLWATLYWQLSPALVNSGMRPVDNLESLAIFAEHEAEELLILSIERHQKLRTPDLSFASFTAVVEAARLGNTQMVKKLLLFPLPGGEMFDRPILAAIESGNKDVLELIIQFCRNIDGKIRDTTSLLARAASLGNSAFVKILLEFTKSTGRDITDSNTASLLSLACWGGNSEIVRLLIGEGIATITSEPKTKNGIPLPIWLAVQWGKTEVLETLRLEIAMSPKDSAAIEYYKWIFHASSVLGRRKPAQDILHYLDSHFHCINNNLAQTMDQENKVANYLHRDVIGDSFSLPDPANAITQTIRLWPYAIDLIDLLTGRKQKVMKDPRFSFYFKNWIQAAVKSGDIAPVKLLFENGTKSPRATDQVLEHIATIILYEATISGSVSCMKYAIEKGADFQTRLPSYAYTPLCAAAIKQREAGTAVLLKAGANVNGKGNDVWFPIHCCLHNADITRQLIAAGADVNVRSTPDSGEGISPLELAVIQDEIQVVEELLKAKPNPQTIQSSIKAATKSTLAHMMKKILPHCLNASYLPDIDYLLHSQMRSGSLATFELLLAPKFQLDLDKKDSNGNAALHFINKHTSAEIVELFIKRGANIELENNNGQTPLIVAAINVNEPVARCLVENGARVNTISKSGYGPFHLACRQGALGIVKIMHTSKTDPADVNQFLQSNFGTPLNAALFSHETAETRAVVQYLLEEGHAQIDVQSPFWSGALQTACLTSSIEVVRMLIEQYHASVTVVDNTGRTPLHMALYRTREHIKLLQEHGADIDAVDVLERNALHYAVLSGRLDVVKLVLDERPKLVDWADSHGWTPLLWALRAVNSNFIVHKSDMRAIIQELLDRGARRLIRGDGIDRTWTPMKVARYYHVDQDIIDLLTARPGDFEHVADDDRGWDWKSGGDKRGVFRGSGAYCDHCLMGFCGIYYSCTGSCNAAYCLHCYQSIDKLHNEHQMEICGEEEDDVSNDATAGMDDREDSERDTESDDASGGDGDQGGIEEEADEDEEMSDLGYES